MANKTIQKLFVIGVVILGLVLVVGGYYALQPQSPAFTESTPPTSTPVTPGGLAEILAPASHDQTYRYQSFSLAYPRTWTAFDSAANPDFFTANGLDSFEHGVVLEKDGYVLYIGMDTTSQQLSENSFPVNDLQQWLDQRDPVEIQGETYYLLKTHASLGSQPSPYALAEYFAPTTVFPDGQGLVTYRDSIYRDDISYAVAILSRTAGQAAVTPPAVQAELIGILSTIAW